jgi:hypothetical protein
LNRLTYQATGEPEFRDKVRQVLTEYKMLFRKSLGMFNDGIGIPIRFPDENDLAGLKQNPYRLSSKDRKAMDEILNSLKQDGRIEDAPLGDPSPVSSPVFVVWVRGKPRVVIDLRKVNTKV